MQLNRNQIIEINLRNLFFHILYRWRSILIAALIGAIVLCGYQYLSIKTAHDAGKLTKEERQYQIDFQQYKEGLASSKNTVRVYTKLLQEQNDYLNNSIYIQLSPQSVWVASSKYLVKLDQAITERMSQSTGTDPADSILPLYSVPLSEVTDEEELKEAFGTDNTEYINELVITSTNIDDNTVTVFVLGESKEAAQRGLSLVKTQMEKISVDKVQDTESHRLICIADSISRGLDKEMSEKIDLSLKQENLAKKYEEIQTILQEARLKLERLETNGGPKEPGLHIAKISVIGAAVGVVILVVLYTVLYILKGKLNNSRDLTERYKIPIFGEFSATNKCHTGKGLDHLIARWELGNNVLSDDTVNDSVAALIAENQEAKKLLLVSTLPTDKLNAIKEALAKRLPEKNIEVQADATQNSNAITEASKADAIIIAEAKGVSRLKNIDRVAENLIIAKANVIGAIIL